MFCKLLFLSALILTVNSYPEIKYNEVPCMASGGMCVKQNECPKGKLSETRGLCPTRQHEGYECCYGVSLKETRCRQNGGECIAKPTQCPPGLIFSRASDCGANQKCCIFV